MVVIFRAGLFLDLIFELIPLLIASLIEYFLEDFLLTSKYEIADGDV